MCLKLIMCLVVMLRFKPSSCSQKFDEIGMFVRQKIDMIPTYTASDGYVKNQVSNDALQPDIMLRWLSLGLNHTIGNKKLLLTQARSSGNFYVLLGAEVQRMRILDDQFQVVSVGRIDDIGSAVTTEFEVEEINGAANRTTLIVSLYLEDRFQIYQIPLSGTVQIIKSIQKIGRSGRSTKTYLLVYMSNLYLISGYVENDTAKLALYRWLDYHFSIEDIKEVPMHSQVIIHNHKQLVILVLQPGEYPERSINHIYILNEQRKLMKTQEMYYLYNRLPYYEIDNELYILRCMALDKCFLYKWNGENLFLRASKVSLDPRDIVLIGSGYNLSVILFRKTLYIYHNQPLLKIASSYIITDKRGTVTDNRMYFENNINQIIIYKERDSNKIYLFVFYQEGTTLFDLVELKINRRRASTSVQGEQATFNALKSCLMNIKDTVNIRKGWIDLMKFQIKQMNNICQKSSSSHLAVKNVFLADSTVAKRILINGRLHASPQTIVQIWNLLKKSLYDAHTLSKELLFVNRENKMQSNLKIRGNLHTKAAAIKSITVQPVVRRDKGTRQKRNFQSLRRLNVQTVNAKEVLYNGKTFTGLLSIRKINYGLPATHVNNIFTSNIHQTLGRVNRIPIKQAIFNSSEVSLLHGRKFFRGLSVISLNFSHINGEASEKRFSALRKAIMPDENDGTIQLVGVRKVNNLTVNALLNNVNLRELLKELYYTNKRSTVHGNLLLRSSVNIRNINSPFANHIATDQFFDMTSNQTITATAQISKVYATLLENHHLNGLVIPSDLSFASATRFIKDAFTSNLIVAGDLTLSADDQEIPKHILGTNIDDFSQIYTRSVFLKGSLYLKNIRTDMNRSQIVIGGIPVTTAVNKYFWMKKYDQGIENVAFQRQIVLTQLYCNDLNYHPLKSYLRLHNWQTSLSLNFIDMQISGNTKTYTVAPNFVHYIYSEAVPQATLSTVYGQKVSTGELNVDILVADFVNELNMQHFVTDNNIAETLVITAKQINNLFVKNCDIKMFGRINARKFHNLELNTIIKSCVNSRDTQKVDFMAITELNCEHLQTRFVNGLNIEQLIAESNNYSRIDISGTKLKIDNLVAKANVVSTKQIFVEILNLINVQEYISLLSLKDTSRHLEIGGTKIVNQWVAVKGNLHTSQINYVYVDNLLFNSVRISTPQTIVGLWSFGDIGTKYITSKYINDLPTKHLLNVNLITLKILQDISAENIFSTSATGHAEPNVLSLLSLSKIEHTNGIYVHGLVSVEQLILKTTLYDLMIFGVTNVSDAIEHKIVFGGKFINFENLYNENKIVSKGCNFINLVKDSVKLRYPTVVLRSPGRTLYNAVCQHVTVCLGLLRPALINNVNVMNLNHSILAVGYHPEIIDSSKLFERPFQAKNVVINDGMVASNIYPHHIIHSLYEISKAQFDFEAPIQVIGNIHIDAINNYSLQHFLTIRAITNQSLFRDALIDTQQLKGFLTVSALVMVTDQNTVQAINEVYINDIVAAVTNEHQAIFEFKHINGKAYLFGPTSVLGCNGFNILDTFKSSALMSTSVLQYENVILHIKSLLNDGITIKNKINNIDVNRMMKFRVSSIEELLPLMPAIRTQLVNSKKADKADVAKEARMLYIESSVLYSESESTHITDNEIVTGMSNLSYVTFVEAYINGMKRYNVTIRTQLPEGELVYTKIPVHGELIQARWRELSYGSMKNLLILLLTRHNKELVLTVHVHRNNQFINRQDIDIQASTAAFTLVEVNGTSTVLAISDKTQLPQGNIATKLKLYYYNFKNMLFTHFKTLSGEYSTIVALSIEDSIMVAVSEIGANVLIIFTNHNIINALYQKIVFDSLISSVGVFDIQGVPALRISTIDKVIYIYIHTSLEGWKQYSYGRLQRYTTGLD